MANRWTRFARETLFHGIPEMANARGTTGRIFWGVVLLTATVLFSLQIETLVRQYLSEETGTEIRSWAPDRIPTISICPANYLREERVRQNLGVEYLGLGDMAPAAVQGVMAYMDSFLVMGYMYRAIAGQIDAQAQESTMNSFPPFMVALVKKSVSTTKVYSKYGNSLRGFIENNSLAENELFAEAIRVSPLQTSYTIRPDVTWAGLCYAVNFEIEVSAMQLQFLQIDIALHNARPNLDNENKAKQVGMDFNVLKDVQAQIDIRLGRMSYKGVTGFSTGKVEGGMEYTIDIQPSKVKRVSLRRKKCETYTDEQYMYCAISFLNQQCKHCKIMFPYDQLSAADNVSECNYVIKNFEDNDHCLVQGAEMLKLKKAELDAACPHPCASEYYRLMMHPPRKMHQGLENQTKIHFVFRNIALSVVQREYPLMNIPRVLSNLGGTMGLYFGSSLLSWVHLIYYLVILRQRNGGQMDGQDGGGQKSVVGHERSQ